MEGALDSSALLPFILGLLLASTFSRQLRTDSGCGARQERRALRGAISTTSLLTRRSSTLGSRRVGFQPSGSIDWERFTTRKEAKQNAIELALPRERYTIEQFVGSSCQHGNRRFGPRPRSGVRFPLRWPLPGCLVLIFACRLTLVSHAE